MTDLLACAVALRNGEWVDVSKMSIFDVIDIVGAIDHNPEGIEWKSTLEKIEIRIQQQIGGT